MKSENSVSIKKINRKLQQNPIAIIGMASLLPQARNLSEYWGNIVNKIDCITDIPASHWKLEDYYDPNPRTTKDKTYCKRGGFIPEVDFNPMEFGLPPNILEVTDVSQLLSLVVAKEAMQDAGYDEKRDFIRETVGVVLGVAQGGQLAMPLAARLQYPVWEKVLKSSGLSDEDTEIIIEKIKSAYVKWNENAFPGMLGNVVAGRIANRLNLGGINCVVDAACASSFGALRMAISELTEYRSDMMLTGGVDLDNSAMAYVSFSKTPAVSPGENVKPFDAKSDGMMLGEGIGMILLKRLEDAERDNDKIYAVIKGIGTSSDGRYKSIYAPRLEGQVAALKRAYDDAGFAPESVGLIEAHGTGTMAGDPTEFSSLREFFGQEDANKQHIALGSVKSQIGHTKAAAGAASLIKTALALHHKILPATINITEPNPKLNIENSRFYLNTETRPWIRADGEPPRRAGVSSFGFGGTNYHVVLEEHQAEQIRPYRLHNTPAEVLLFAENPAQLFAKCQEIFGKLHSEAADKYYAELVQECKVQEIPTSAARVGFVADSLAEASKFLQTTIDCLKSRTSATSWEHPQGIYYRSSGIDLTGKVVSLFSGQGSQYLEMGRELVMNFPVMRRLYGYMDSLLKQDNLQPLSEIVFPAPVFAEAQKNAQIAVLQQTEYAQPAIGVFSAGLYTILQQAGFKSDFVAGHSFGELTALWAAGVLSEADYLFLVKARGQAMATFPEANYDAGAMLAVKEDITKVEAVVRHFPEVKIANQNSPRQVVLAGPTAEIANVRQALQDKGYAAVLLPVAAAFHTPLIGYAEKAFNAASGNVTFNQPKIPVYTNVTGSKYPQEPSAIQQVLATHLSSSVLFKQEIENIYAAGGYCFVEFGPKRILANLVKDILGDRPHLTIAFNPSTQKNSDRSLREGVVQLRVAGLALQNLDPYQITAAIPTVDKKALNVRLKGVNYVSENTKNAFEKALQDGHQVKFPTLKAEEKVVVANSVNYQVLANHLTTSSNGKQNGKKPVSENSTIKSEPVISTSATAVAIDEKDLNSQPPQIMPQVSNSHSSGITANFLHPPAEEFQMEKTPEKLLNYQMLLESLEYVLAQFQQNQSENVQLHGQYLNHQVEYAKTFFELMQQQHSLFANNQSAIELAKLKPVVMESLERSMSQFHTQQGETLRIHEQYLNHQVEYTKSFFELVQQEYSQLLNGSENTQVEVSAPVELPVIPQPETVVPPTVKIVETKEIKLSSIEKNGSTTPVAEIKPEIKLEPVAEIKLEIKPEIKLEIKPEPVVKEIIVPPTVKIPEIKPEPVIEIPAIPASVSVDIADLGKNLLTITSEKTGYPVEMLELDMDMEADLGIDSIKRVEILGSLQDLYPDLPKPNLEELAEKRTIGQVVEYLQSNASMSASVEIAIQEVQKAAEIPEVITVATVPNFESIPVVENVVIHADTEVSEPAPDLGKTLLAITSEKTGYPVEMLELDMDMEADLGIDSIKRVEILGTMQEMYPDLPKPNVEELTELRTIGQIVEYLEKLVGAEKKKFQPQPRKQPVKLNHNIQRRQVKLKTLPQPDYWEFSPPEGQVALITDDGTLTTSKLAQSLIKENWQVVVLSFPESLVSQSSPLPVEATHIKLTDLSEEHLKEQLAAIATNYGSIGSFIHIHPAFQVSHNGRIPYLEEEKAIVKYVFFMAKHLKKSLNEAAGLGRSCFCTVARLDGAFGLKYKGNFGAIGAGLFGLTKTLNWEWEKVFCRAIDLSPAIDAEQSARLIVGELHDPNLYITEVGYGSQGRVTLIASK